MLYVTVGDEHSAQAAQDTADVRGKILRYHPDGTVPSDNPFSATNPVWAYGFRNPFGIAVSTSGQMAVTSNAPTGDAGSPSTGHDTLVLDVVRGRGYQWPDCYGYSHPLVLAVLEERGISTEGLRSKSLDEFAGQSLDVILTICDRVRESCSTFPGDPECIHWSFADPAAVEGSLEERHRAFEQTSLQLATQLRYLLILLERAHRR